MNKISCNVIRDLLPSYTDGIASEDSIRLVEEHLAHCHECMAFKGRMEKPDFHIAKEPASLDYMKKIRKLTDLKSAVCFLLVLITGVFFLEYTKDLHQSKQFFVLAAVMLLSNYLLFFHNNQKEAVGKARAVIANAVSLLLTLYIMLIMHVSISNWLNGRRAPFNIDYVSLGPFLYKQLLLIMLLEIVIWVRELALHIKKSHFSIVSSSFGIIGFYMSLYYMRMLGTIQTLDSFHIISVNAQRLFAEGIGILLFIIIFEKIKGRNN